MRVRVGQLDGRIGELVQVIGYVNVPSMPTVNASGILVESAPRSVLMCLIAFKDMFATGPIDGLFPEWSKAKLDTLADIAPTAEETDPSIGELLKKAIEEQEALGIDDLVELKDEGEPEGKPEPEEKSVANV